MMNASESLPARIKVTCPDCGRQITTGQSSGNNTRCPTQRGGCGARVYVPAGQTRPAVTLSCLHCQAVFDTRAKAGNVVRCRNCKKPRRVPAGIRSQPVDYYPEPPPPRRRAPRSSPPPRSVWSPPPAVPAATAPARTTTPARRPTPGPTLVPGRVIPSRDQEKDRRRRDSVTALVTSLGGRFRVAYDTPNGMCEGMDCEQPRESQRCRGIASRAVVFSSSMTLEVAAHACPAHAVALAAMADRSDQVSARIFHLNN